MSSTAPTTGSLDTTMGVLFTGVVLAMGLWGAGTVQVYYYYDRFPKDPLWIKCVVGAVWALDTVHQGLIMNSIYEYLVTHYADPNYLNIVTPSLMIEVSFSAFVVILVQGFFLIRIWRLSQNYVIVGFCGCVVIANFICAMIYTVRSQQIEKTYTALTALSLLSRLVNILSAASDFLIAVSLIFYLQTSRTGFKRSDTMINRLIIFSLNTGLLTSLDAIASLITFTLLGKSFLYLMFYVTNCKLYTNSLLASLNSRRGFSGALDDNSDSTSWQEFSDRRYPHRAAELGPASRSKNVGNNAHTLSIKVDTETTMIRDIDGHGDKHSATSDPDVYHYGKP